MSGVKALAERRPAKASTPIPKHYLKDYRYDSGEYDVVGSDVLDSKLICFYLTISGRYTA